MNLLLEESYKVRKEIVRVFGENSGYYTGSELFGYKDESRKEPACFISTTNRSAGKTTFLLLLAKQIWEDYGKTTVFTVRSVAELGSYRGIFSDVQNLYGWKEEIGEKVILKDGILEISMGNKTFSHVVSLKKSDAIKKFSPIFKDTILLCMDEYQTENGRYLKDEVNLFRSIYRTVSRGGGEQSRNVKILMLGNPVTLLNPYLLAFGISKKYSFGQNYIRGKRIVAEFRIIEEARKKLKENPATELFGEDETKYECGEEFLMNDNLYLEKCKGKSTYLFTLLYGKNAYGIRKYNQKNIIHVGRGSDPGFQKVLAFREKDRTHNAELLEKRCFTWQVIMEAYRTCRLRFDSLESKYMIFELLNIDLYA